MTQQQLGKAVGTTGQYVNRIIKKKDGVINVMMLGSKHSIFYV